MTYAAAVLAVACFAAVLRLVGVFGIAGNALEISRKAAGLMRDPSLTDAEKERATQKASLALLVSFFSISARTVVAVGVSLLPLLAFEAIGLARWTDVLHLLATWQGIILAAAMMMLAYADRIKF